MILQFSVDTDEMYGEDGIDFESLLSDSFRKELVANCKDKIASEQFKTFSKLTENTIIADIKLRMENFLSEEIALTGDWGKKTFVGSIEDLIKQRFDDILLRPVDNGGQTLNGCTSSERTWVEWRIEKQLKEGFDRVIKDAASTVLSDVKKIVNSKLIEIKDNALKQEVDDAFMKILKK